MRPADGFIFCTIEEVGLYPNNSYIEKLEAIRKAFNKQEHQTTSMGESLIRLVEFVLKNVFEQEEEKS